MDKKSDGVIVRKASYGDIPFVSWAIVEAITDNPEELSLDPERLEEVCKSPDTTYSLKNIMVAEVEGQVVGALVCYPGEIYEKGIAESFRILGMDPKIADRETGPGEFYLDSLAVKDGFRGRGIGTTLLKAGFEKASGMGYSKVTLIVSPSKPSVKGLYSHLGFEPKGKVSFFGEDYQKMEKTL